MFFFKFFRIYVSKTSAFSITVCRDRELEPQRMRFGVKIGNSSATLTWICEVIHVDGEV